MQLQEQLTHHSLIWYIICLKNTHIHRILAQLIHSALELTIVTVETLDDFLALIYFRRAKLNHLSFYILGTKVFV